MNAVKNLMARLVGDEEGQDLIEYAMLATFVSLVAIVGAKLLGTALNNWYSTIAPTWAAQRGRPASRAVARSRSRSTARGNNTCSSLCTPLRLFNTAALLKTQSVRRPEFNSATGQGEEARNRLDGLCLESRRAVRSLGAPL
jgi:Flp pilus assembly pilin Flp